MQNPVMVPLQNKRSIFDKLNIVKRIQLSLLMSKRNDPKVIPELLAALNSDSGPEHICLAEVKGLMDCNVYHESSEYLEYVLSWYEGQEHLRDIYFLLARCYLGQGLINQALSRLDRILSSYPNDSELWNLKADCLLELGEWQDGITCLNKALRSSPSDAETIYRLGSIYLFHGEYGEALNCFSGCCKLKPFNPDYWEMKAEMLLKLDRLLAACECFNKAVRYGGSIHCMTRLAYCYAKLGQVQKAQKLFAKVLKYEPDHFDALCNLASLYQEMGKGEQAYKLLKKAYTLNCNDPLLLNNLGFVSFALGRSRKAVEYYQEALKIKPDDNIVLYNLGACLADKGRWEEACETLERLILVDKTNSNAWILLGNIYEQLSNHQMAVDCFNKSLGLAK